MFASAPAFQARAGWISTAREELGLGVRALGVAGGESEYDALFLDDSVGNGDVKSYRRT